MCLELMIERAEENVSFGGINICVSSLEGLCWRVAALHTTLQWLHACAFSSILMEAACAQQLQYKSLCLLISYYFWQVFLLLFIRVLVAIFSLLSGMTCEDNHEIYKSKGKFCFLPKLVCKKGHY